MGGGEFGTKEQDGIKKDTEVTLNTENSSLLNSNMFASIVKTDELFSEANKSILKNQCCYPVLGIEGVIMVPSTIVKPSFFSHNNIFYKEPQQMYLDKLMPMTAVWIPEGEEKVKKILDWVYDDDDVYSYMTESVCSLEKHTGVYFPTPEMKIERDEHKCVFLEKNFGDQKWCFSGSTENNGEFCIILYMFTIHLLQIVANEDLLFKFSSYTPIKSVGDYTVGPFGVDLVGILGMQKEPHNLFYDPPQDDVYIEDPKMFILENSKNIMLEYRRLLWQMFRFGPGDSGNKADAFNNATEFTNSDFEKRVCKFLFETADDGGSESLACFAASLTIKDFLCTMVNKEIRLDYEDDQQPMWRILVGMYVGNFTTQTVAFFDTKFENKSLKLTYHMLTKNPCFNLQTTGAKGSAGVCGLILYLTSRLRCLQNTKSNVKELVGSQGLKCSMCKSKTCPHEWIKSYTEDASIINIVQTGSGIPHQSGSKSVNALICSEFNAGASIMGSTSTSGNERKNIGLLFTLAHQKTVERFKTRMSGNIQLRGFNEICRDFENALSAIDKYIAKEEYGVQIPHRSTFKGNKLELVLSDTQTGLQKNTLGMVGVIHSKSYLVVLMSRCVQSRGLSLESFGKNPKQQKNEINQLMAKVKLGIFQSIPSLPERMTVKHVPICPIHNDATGQMKTLNDGIKDATNDRPSELFDKCNSKYKTFLSSLKRVDSVVPQNICNGGMINTGMDQDYTAASNTQLGNLRNSISSILSYLHPEPAFRHLIYNKGKRRIQSIATKVSKSMCFFGHDALKSKCWLDFLEKYVACKLLESTGFVRQDPKNDFYDGSMLASFVEMINSDPKVNRSSVFRVTPHNLITTTGPTLLIVNLSPGEFDAEIEGQKGKSKFFVMNIQYFGLSKLFSGDSAFHLLNQKHLGFYYILKSIEKNQDPNRPSENKLLTGIQELEGMNISERCNKIKEIAPLILKNIRQRNGYPEIPDQNEPDNFVLTFEIISDWFNDINPFYTTCFLQDECVKNVLLNLEHDEEMLKICESVPEENFSDTEYIDEDEDEDEDHTEPETLMDIDGTDTKTEENEEARDADFESMLKSFGQ